jgi:hypothetical protein
MTVAEYAKHLAAENFDQAQNLSAALARELTIQRTMRRAENRAKVLRGVLQAA